MCSALKINPAGIMRPRPARRHMARTGWTRSLARFWHKADISTRSVNVRFWE
jgi:hypothetical protein